MKITNKHNMKSTKKKTTGASIPSFIIPLTLEAVKQHLQPYREAAPHELSANGARIEAAKRNAWCDLSEAKAKLELKKLGGDSGSQRQIELEVQLSEIDVQRRIGRIFESIACEAENLASAACQAKPYSDRLAVMETEKQALTERLADLRVRDIREELANYETLQNEINWATQVLDSGKWRRGSLDNREQALEEELGEMQAEGKYRGDISLEGVHARIEEVQAMLAKTDARFENRLDEREFVEIRELPERIAEIDAAIQEETRYAHLAIESARFQEKRFNELLEAARITTGMMVEFHEITRETAALKTA